MSSNSEERQQATSTELTGGAGFTYEDTVVAYYLAALLREERAAGLNGVVKTVAVQQGGHGHPMDDIIVEFDDDGARRELEPSGQAQDSALAPRRPTRLPRHPLAAPSPPARPMTLTSISMRTALSPKTSPVDRFER